VIGEWLKLMVSMFPERGLKVTPWVICATIMLFESKIYILIDAVVWVIFGILRPVILEDSGAS